MSKRAIAILSGGLDSAFSFLKGLRQYELLLALTFDYGQRAAIQEIRSAFSLCKQSRIPHRVIGLDWLRGITFSALVATSQKIPHPDPQRLDDPHYTELSAKQVWVPNRNGLFLNIAACFAESHQAEVILTGFNQEEAATFPDNSAPFVDAINRALTYSTRVRPRVESFALPMTKEEIVREGILMNLPFERLWSCYEGGEKQCGACESCLRLKRAYEKNGIDEKFKDLFSS